MSTIKHYKSEIEKTEDEIRTKKLLPKEIADILTLYHEKVNSFYEELKPEMEEKKKYIEECHEAIRAIRKTKTKGVSQAVMERYDSWARGYRSGVNFGYHKSYIREILEDGKWVIITSSGSTAGTGTAMGASGYYNAKSHHWLAEVNQITYIQGNKFCEHYGRLGKKEKELMRKAAQLFVNGAADKKHPNSHSIVKLFPFSFTEEEKTESAQHA